MIAVDVPYITELLKMLEHNTLETLVTEPALKGVESHHKVLKFLQRELVVHQGGVERAEIAGKQSLLFGHAIVTVPGLSPEPFAATLAGIIFHRVAGIGETLG